MYHDGAGTSPTAKSCFRTSSSRGNSRAVVMTWKPVLLTEGLWYSGNSSFAPKRELEKEALWSAVISSPKNCAY